MDCHHKVSPSEQTCQIVPSDVWLAPWPRVDREYIWTYPLVRDEVFDKTGALRSADVPCPSNKLVVYVHVPACLFHCPMCPFYHEIVPDRSYLDGYYDVIIEEFEAYEKSRVFEDKELSAIYFGGGTASLLSPIAIERIISVIRVAFPHSPQPEITVECHPKTVDREYLTAISDKGVNRVSFGIQSFDDGFLKALGLRQRAESSKEILSAAVSLPFDTVSIDLLYRIPDQTVQDVIKSVDQALELGITSLSAYSLELSVQQTRFKGTQPGDQTDREMFYTIMDKLMGLGWCHQAQPDFAAKGHEHREIDISWSAPQGHVLGLGAGAWSVFNGRSFYNVHSIEKYSRLVEASQLPIAGGQAFSLDDAITRYLVLGARAFEIPATPFEQTFGLNFFDTFSFEIDRLEERGLVVRSSDGLSITRKGKHYVDSVSKQFYSYANRNRLQPWGARISALEPDE